MDTNKDDELGNGSGGPENIGGNTGDAPDALTVTDPATGAQPAKPKRGRPPGSKTGSGGSGTSTKTATEKPPTVTARVAERISSSVIEKLLLGIHTGIVAMTKNPSFAISPSDASELAKAVQDVNAFYDTAPLNPKTLAWVNLGTIGAAIYGPMIVMSVQARKKVAPQMAAPRPMPVPSPQNTQAAQREIVEHIAANVGVGLGQDAGLPNQ